MIDGAFDEELEEELSKKLPNDKCVLDTSDINPYDNKEINIDTEELDLEEIKTKLGNIKIAKRRVIIILSCWGLSMLLNTISLIMKPSVIKYFPIPLNALLVGLNAKQLYDYLVEEKELNKQLRKYNINN